MVCFLMVCRCVFVAHVVCVQGKSCDLQVLRPTFLETIAENTAAILTFGFNWLLYHYKRQKQSCMHCHMNEDNAYFSISTGELSLAWMNNNFFCSLSTEEIIWVSS